MAKEISIVLKHNNYVVLPQLLRSCMAKVTTKNIKLIFDTALSEADNDSTLLMLELEGRCISAIIEILNGIFTNLNSDIEFLTAAVQIPDTEVDDNITSLDQYTIFVGVQKQSTVLIHNTSNSITTDVSYSQGDVIICKPGTTTLHGNYNENHVYFVLYADISNAK